jgi:uncharacterized membrane protein
MNPVKLDQPLGSTFSQGWGVNDSGDVVGYSLLGGVETPYVWTGLTPSLLALLAGQTAGRGWDINNDGLIVGYGQQGSSLSALIWDSGVAYDLNTLLDGTYAGTVLQVATAISEDGKILVQGTQNGLQRTFLLTPTDTDPEQGTGPGAVLEPSSYGLLLGGLSAMAGAHRLRRKKA